MGTVQYSTSFQMSSCTSLHKGAVACRNAIRRSSEATPGIPSNDRSE
jgi:hypothetical protein